MVLSTHTLDCQRALITLYCTLGINGAHAGLSGPDKRLSGLWARPAGLRAEVLWRQPTGNYPRAISDAGVATGETRNFM